MRIAFFNIILGSVCLLACAQGTKVTPAGPAVPDQLRSRGYITTPGDTVVVQPVPMPNAEPDDQPVTPLPSMQIDSTRDPMPRVDTIPAPPK